MKLVTLLFTSVLAGTSLGGNGSTVHKVMIPDQSLIEYFKVAIDRQSVVCINGVGLIPSDLHGAINRYTMKAKTLEGESSLVKIRIVDQAKDNICEQ